MSVEIPGGICREIPGGICHIPLKNHGEALGEIPGEIFGKFPT